MKKILAVALLVASSSVLANPITDAVKENAWPTYHCTLDVNGAITETITNKEQYQNYSIRDGVELFEYTIDSANLILRVEKEHNKVRKAEAVLYKLNDGIRPDIVGMYKGTCK